MIRLRKRRGEKRRGEEGGEREEGGGGGGEGGSTRKTYLLPQEDTHLSRALDAIAQHTASDAMPSQFSNVILLRPILPFSLLVHMPNNVFFRS